ncbi:TonB-dependent receptor [Citrobacter freundii]|uniref:TonB-dependent receptor n=1 Tax=Citrobacter freundii TaxID=546 RepID=A0A7G2ITN0_CITFR|nr:TonB-dependent receptor [Citrobacter freundii]
MQTLSKKVLDQQQIKDVKDAYRYLPSVQGDGVRPQTRGMQGSVVQNHMIDGLNAVSTTEYSTEQFQNIEVLSGIAGSLYGPANPAGMFNLVSKTTRRYAVTPRHRGARYRVGYADVDGFQWPNRCGRPGEISSQLAK